MTKIILVGANGKMGRVISARVAERDDAQIIAGVDINTEKYADFPIFSNINEITDTADVIIDFSHPSVLESVLGFIKERKIPAVIATTGLSPEQINTIREASTVAPIFFSANMSLGVNLLVALAKKATEVLSDTFDIEIIEKHHNQKLDAPSGTALMLADAISDSMENPPQYTYDRHSRRAKRSKNEIGIHAVRGGTIVGEHDIIFAGNDEIIEISHTAMSKDIFATGSIKAGIWLKNQASGLYSMADMLKF